MDHSKILGVVLAGGKSLRFGEDKSQVKLKDKSLIDYVLSEVIDEFKSKGYNACLSRQRDNFGCDMFFIK